MTRTLLIDNYDSFTYNVYDLLTHVNGQRPTVVRNDVPFDTLHLDEYDNVVVSPGPGRPDRTDDFGVCARVIAESTLPVLGICLGHQGLGASYGARVVRADEPMHGRVSQIRHSGTDLFDGLASPLSVVRYHSLVVADLPTDLEATAWTDDGVLMAMRHTSRPQWGVQFHPESISSDGGRRLLGNFRDLSRKNGASRDLSRKNGASRDVSRSDGGSSFVSAPTATDPAPAPTPRYVVEHVEVPRNLDPRAVRDALARRTPAANADTRFWLDGSAKNDAASRFTIIGDADGPRAEYITYDVESTTVRVRRSDGGVETVRSPFFDFLDHRLRETTIAPDDPTRPLPFDFRLGFVGYLGYELKAETCGRAAHSSPDPDAAMVFADRAVVLDHDGHRAFALCLSAEAGEPASRAWLDEMTELLTALPDVADSEDAPAPAIATHPSDTEITLRHSHTEYVDRVRECLDLIRAGETYEVCLTNAGSVEASIDPVTTFDNLRRVSPVPHAALLEFGSFAVVSTSPERFLRIGDDRVVESKPIKGTRPRGLSDAADSALRDDLLGSEKDIAENLMIVDLVRNDLSRVCAAGTVHVPTLFGVETYATVHQLVSTVRGTLAPAASVVDCIRATFPGGSMTGAPKIRTMEIIDRLEEGPRGVYSGSIGYLSLSGSADLSIVIRTMVVTDDRVRFGIGGAITALSDPEDEFEETLVKASTVQKALSLAPAPIAAAQLTPPSRPLCRHDPAPPRRPTAARSRRS